MSKRILLFPAVLALIVCLLSACGEKKTESAASDSNPTRPQSVEETESRPTQPPTELSEAVESTAEGIELPYIQNY